MRHLALLVLPLLLVACDDADLIPVDLPVVTVAELAEAAPGLYATDAFALVISECPPDAFCPVEDNVTIGDAVNAMPDARISVLGGVPGRIEVGERYRFYIEVEELTDSARRYTYASLRAPERL